MATRSTPACVRQANWNNTTGATGTKAALVADNDETAVATTASVEWSCPTTWASTGSRGEQNCLFTGTDLKMMIGYLDTGNATTTRVTVRDIPSELTAGGYTVYVYTLGGVSGRGGGYRIANTDGTEITPWKLGTSLTSPSTYIEDPGVDHTDTGDYLVFPGITASTIVIEASTEFDPFGGTPRAPLNGVQLVGVTQPRPIVTDPVGDARGFFMSIDDFSPVIVNANSVTVQLDGQAIQPQVTKTGGTTLIIYNALTANNTFLPQNSTHTVAFSYRSTAGTQYSATREFSVGAYASVPAEFKTTQFSGRGMRAYVNQIAVERLPGDVNTIINAEQQAGNGYIDPATGQPYENTADLSLAVMGAFPVQTVNWEQEAVDVGGAEHFNSGLPVDNPIPNDPIPGIPGINPDIPNNNITAATVGYMELARGFYRFGVASDDGFKMSFGLNANTPFGTTVGSFNTGRGVADSIFDFIVEETGVYPVRLLWWEGNGGANVEWFSMDQPLGQASGTPILVNDPNRANAIKVFASGRGRAYVKSLLPFSGYTGVAQRPTFKAVIVDDLTSASDVQLGIDGQVVEATISKVGTTTTVTYTPPGLYLYDTAHDNNWLQYTESTPTPTVQRVPFTFRVRSYGVEDMPPAPPSFVIEAEDFDFDGGQTHAGASIMPLENGQFDGYGAISNVDYWQDYNEPASDLYRTGEDPNIPMDPNNTAGTLDVQRPGYTASSNYKIGWVGGNEWYNYTRTIPAGLYTAYGAQSYDPGRIVGGRLGLVTDGVGTTTQTVKNFGQISGPCPGGWGNNALLPLLAADGSQGVFKLPGGQVTLRYTTDVGDFDWFVLIPVSGIQPKVTAKPLDSVRRDAVILDWTLEDYSTQVNAATMKVLFDGVEMPSGVTCTKTADGATVHYEQTALMDRGIHTWTLQFKDSAGADISSSGTFIVNPYPTEGVFAIEAEDFNYDNGKIMPEVNTMPYTGGAYDGLSAVLGVDYNSTNGNDSDVYRLGESPNKNIASDTWSRYTMTRGVWDMTVNYKLGWAGDSEWCNYTRTIPQGTYEVWAALSFDGRGADNCRASLAKVTSDPKVGGQTAATLGIFRGAATGGWGANDLFPMRDVAGGPVKTIDLPGGELTFKFTANSGDFDYLLLVPAGGPPPPPPQFTSWVKNANGSITVTWTGGGTLQAAPAVTGPWQDVPTATSPYTLTPDQQMLFGRIKR